MSVNYLDITYIEKNCIRNKRDYYIVSHDRWKNAINSFLNEDYFASIYLAGYSAECILKYVILETLDDALLQGEKTISIRKLIRQNDCYGVLKSHDLKGLMELGNETNVFKVPKESDFVELVKWTAEWRYSITSNADAQNTMNFLQSVELLSQQLVTELEGKVKLRELTFSV